jgi:hypothetical protein
VQHTGQTGLSQKAPKHQTGLPSSKQTQTRNSSNTEQQRTHPDIHPRKNLTRVAPVRSVRGTGPTGVAWSSRDEQDPRVNTPKSKPRSPESLHGLAQDFGDSRNTSWGVHSQVYVHQNLPNQEESKKNLAKNSSNPRAPKTPKSSPLTHGFGSGIKGKRTMKGSHIHPPPNPQEQGAENTPRNPPREGSKNHHQEQTGTTQPSLEEPRRIIYTYQRGSYKVKLAAQSSNPLTRSHHEAFKLILWKS